MARICAGVLPYAIVRQTVDNPVGILFLLGLERDTWSEFAGHREPNEEIFESAARELWEESMGLLGSEAYLRDILVEMTPYLTPGCYVYPLRIPYEPLPKYFDRFYEYFLRTGLPKPKGFFEKDKIAWFSIYDIQNLKLRFPATLMLAEKLISELS